MLKIIFCITFSVGIFYILLDVLKIPKLAIEKTMINATKNKTQKTDNIEVLLSGLAAKLSKYMYIDDYKKTKLKHILNATNVNKTPEEFITLAILKSVSIALFGAVLLVIFPLGYPVILIFAILIYFREIQKAENILKDKRDKIERELPIFVSTIAQELVSSRDILKILDTYKGNTTDDFANELDILVADMRSSSYESAIVRFETKINSPMLSDVSRGLIAVLRGDDAVTYFKMLSHDMREMEIRKLKLEAMKIPPKIRIYSFMMLMCFLSTYFVIIGHEIIKAMSGMF